MTVAFRLWRASVLIDRRGPTRKREKERERKKEELLFACPSLSRRSITFAEWLAISSGMRNHGKYRCSPSNRNVLNNEAGER